MYGLFDVTITGPDNESTPSVFTIAGRLPPVLLMVNPASWLSPNRFREDGPFSVTTFEGWI